MATKKRSPTERTLKWLRDQGYIADVVERRIPRSFVTKDFCGFADIIAYRPRVFGVGGEIVAVQATSGPHAAERLEKVRQEPRAMAWLACSARICVVSWALRGKGGARKLWTPHPVWLDYNDQTETTT